MIPNGPELGICRDGYIMSTICKTHEGFRLGGLCEAGMCEDGTDRGTSCTSDEECGTDGNCYLDQEKYACNCVSSFDRDFDVDGVDAARFKMYFGNVPYKNPCNIYPCDGDFDCGTDEMEPMGQGLNKALVEVLFVLLIVQLLVICHVPLVLTAFMLTPVLMNKLSMNS